MADNILSFNNCESNLPHETEFRKFEYLNGNKFFVRDNVFFVLETTTLKHCSPSFTNN